MPVCTPPGPVHRSAVTLFCETPPDLRSILLRSYSQLLGQKGWGATQEPGLALLVLHAVLLHRQHYGSLAQARPYPWSEAELFTGLRVQRRLAKLVSDPAEGMQELAGKGAGQSTANLEPRPRPLLRFLLEECGSFLALLQQPAVLYHLAAFQHPQRLLQTLLQEAARAEKQDLDHYQLDQQVLPSALPPSSPPKNGLYLTGLELHSALWDTRTALLQETLSAQPCLLPPVWVQAVREPSRMPLALCAQRRVHIVSTLPGLD
nr:dynein heavy chain domain-containing protein 1-like [Pelodiscus sinensis]|eukprot:XP_025039544.1 dynein heavy chain domain-containing protein 1-like [Pelodiscus sinensis]